MLLMASSACGFLSTAKGCEPYRRDSGSIEGCEVFGTDAARDR